MGGGLLEMKMAAGVEGKIKGKEDGGGESRVRETEGEERMQEEKRRTDEMKDWSEKRNEKKNRIKDR